MATFIGDYTCKMDAKCRVLFPSAFKKQIGEQEEYRFVVKKDIFENCLVLYTDEEWNRQNQIIRRKINPYNKEHNRFLRNFFRGTAELSLDGNGRFLLPKRLLEEVGIDKEIVMAGMDNKIEIWSKNVYESQDVQDDFATLAENILGGFESLED